MLATDVMMSARRPFAVAVVLLVPLLLVLGAWQLQRAAQKRALEASYVDSIGRLPATPGVEPADFLRVRLHGRFEQALHFLVDNRVSGGRLGYAVVSVFRSEDGRSWLVNRGFIARDDARLSDPTLGTPGDRLSLVGVVWPDLGMLPLFGTEVWPGSWPKRVPRLNVERMAALPAVGAVAREVRLERGQPGVFEAASLDVSFRAARHTGYAVQWFALAAVLAGLLIHNRRRHD